MVSVSKYKWFSDLDLIKILSLLNQGGDKSCVVGGAIRNSLMDFEVKDIDIATTILPNVVMKILSKTNYKVIPIGISYGTVKVIARDKNFDITTLRSDFITYGRRAQVVFTNNWHVDALRRDFTINALYADQQGQVMDYVDGLTDIKNRTIKFIGDADKRIAEDYLRILRLFRFSAHYGKGKIDPDGLDATIRAKKNLKTLSAERIWSEIHRLLEAEDPVYVMSCMHDTGILKEIFPLIQDFSMDKFSLMVSGEKKFGWTVDSLLRFIALIPLQDRQSVVFMAKKICLPRQIKNLFISCVQCNIHENFSKKEINKLIYLHGKKAVEKKIKLFLALNDNQVDLKCTQKILKILEDIPSWVEPVFPLTGNDVLKTGISQGKRVGKILSFLKKKWIDSGFQFSHEELLNHLNELVKNSSK
ncbi:CCA tRNA nucleotidyltransferase [Candidatus Liberibacter sp.]|uniref:CCA tRNA nucleotidyltransferase n=1 Tax=Candidatus Liberibacter sp. TaxID=34022 RepID=UPI0015F4B814|nr:CCA tRNA nucleotidyltransferase [Candidatus Liberibacter sp.]MBA5724394.1 CCA tRNA nucleotidyltransferase [Candidatus Liberibacter sp.]